MDQSSIPSKVCTKCHNEQPLTEFRKDRGCRGGHKNRCRACDRIYERARYQDPEMRARKRQKDRECRARDPEKERGRQRKRYHGDVQKYRDGQRAYRQSRGIEARLKARERTRRAKYCRETGLQAELVDYLAVLQRDGFVCRICGGPIQPAEIRYIHFDHYIPASKGGEHTLDNVVVTHGRCNMRKRSQVLTDAAGG